MIDGRFCVLFLLEFLVPSDTKSVVINQHYCHLCSTKRIENNATAASVAPPMIMIRTSCLAMNLDIGIPATPPTKKKKVVANEIDETDQPSSRLKACK